MCVMRISTVLFIRYIILGEKDLTLKNVEFCLNNMLSNSCDVDKASLDERKITFENIGGLLDVKQKLIEIFIWPLKVYFAFQSL